MGIGSPRDGRRYRTFGEFVDAHQTEVLRYLRRLTRNAADAEDLFQETFMRALPRFDRLRANSFESRRICSSTNAAPRVVGRRSVSNARPIGVGSKGALIAPRR